MQTASTQTAPILDDDGFPDLLKCVQDRFNMLTLGAGIVNLFTTAADGLYDLFLDAIPPAMRQHYTCRSCRAFVERYGNVIAIDPESGAVVSVVWNVIDAPPIFSEAIRKLNQAVTRAVITGVFLSPDPTWGTPQSAPDKNAHVWHHFSVLPAKGLLFRESSLQTAGQAMAAKLEEYGMLCRSLDEFPIDVVRKAHEFLTSGQLYRSEKCEAVAKWLLGLHEKLPRNKALRERWIWLAVASAPAGFCHVRSGMIGTLLEDIQAGLDFADIKAKFDAKMNPLKYQRPQAAPTAGNIARAEVVLAELRAAGSLERRYAKLSDIKTLWLPKEAAKPAPTGLFGHLRPGAKSAELSDMGQVTMTWEKFRRTVLPFAESILFDVPGNQRLAFAALVTAVSQNAPPIMQWDSQDERNPANWYVHHNGSTAADFTLTPGWVKVTAVALQPNMWSEKMTYPQHGESVFFLLQGAREASVSCGAALFPEVLKSEFREIRATIEAYSKSATITERLEAEACGIRLQKGQTYSHRFKVTAKGMRSVYLIDRWD